MLNSGQIKLLQTALRSAGLRGKGFDGRYRMLLSQYRQPNRQPVTSCKQLNNYQLEDLLAICESYGWRMPGKAENCYRNKAAMANCVNVASFAQQKAIEHLAGDLGWNPAQLAGMCRRVTGRDDSDVPKLTPAGAYKVIEALKAILGRQTGKRYENLRQVQKDMEVPTDGQTCKVS